MKKKHPEHVNLERWLVSYADFITLLFAFFVIMYAISQADLAKFAKVAESMRAAFSSGAAGTIDLQGRSGGNTANPLEQVMPPGGRLIDMPAGKTHTQTDRDEELQTLKEKLEETVSLELGVSDLSDKMQLLYDSRGLIVRLSVKDFFESGEIEVAQDLRPLLDRIGRVFLKTPRQVRIEGHAELQEADPAGYPSDWELSAARAGWVARYWISRLGLDPRRIGIAGYGHYRPVTDKKGKWFQGANRRIEVIILNDRYETPDSEAKAKGEE